MTTALETCLREVSREVRGILERALEDVEVSVAWTDAENQVQTVSLTADIPWISPRTAADQVVDLTDPLEQSVANVGLLALEDAPALTDPDSDYQERKPQMNISVDREPAAELGVSLSAVGRSPGTSGNPRIRPRCSPPMILTRLLADGRAINPRLCRSCRQSRRENRPASRACERPSGYPRP